MSFSGSPAGAVDWLFTEDYESATTGGLISVDGIANPEKADLIHAASPVPQTFEAQFGSTAGSASVDVLNQGGNNFLDLSQVSFGGTEAFTVVSSGDEPNAPRGGMAATQVKFRVDSSSQRSFGGRGHHISFYRRLVSDEVPASVDEGPWVNNLGTVGFQQINPTAGTFEVHSNSYLSPFGVPPTDPDTAEDIYESDGAIVTLDLDTWYTAELYVPAFNVETDDDQVNGHYRILSEDGSQLLGYTTHRTFHNVRTDASETFSTETTPEVVGIQTISTAGFGANWQVDDVQIGKGTGLDIDSIYANFTMDAGNYYDFNFDGMVDDTDAQVYVNDYLLTDFGDVDLDRDIDNDDLAIAQGNLNNSGGWDDGDVTGDGVVDAADIAIITAALAGDGLIGDYSSDDFVGQADLDLVLANFGATVLPGGFNAANTTGGSFDGLIGQNELDDVLNNFGNSGAPAAAAIPEPASAVAFLAAGGLVLRRRRLG
ncbi:MAG: PEP-CTERM sorting domain-containing protein [Planctomycetota bacterium]